VLTDERLARLDSSEAPIGRKRGALYVPWWVEEGREDEFVAAAPYVRAVWMWSEMVRRCREELPRDALRIRYEDLVREPLRVGAELARHFRIELASRMRRRLQTAHPRSIGAFRRRDPAEVAEAERIAGEELAAHGYDVPGGTAT
jgi:hypothetical protein